MPPEAVSRGVEESRSREEEAGGGRREAGVGARHAVPSPAKASPPSDELLEALRTRLYTAVVSDVLDRQGLLDQAMSARIRPIAPGMRLIGRAHTMLTADIYQRPATPYEKEIAAVDALKPGDVMVAATNGSERTCLWGELLSTAARARGATGCLIDGHTRDVARILEMGFPVFCTGFRPVDSSSRSVVIDYGCPVLCGGVLVHPGDIIFADIDGIVVIPSDRLATTVETALEKFEAENSSRQMLEDGYFLRDVYDRFGVL
ncbi:MAG: RraA family protein [Thermomicrobiales bacterium]